jgi:protein-tyrosine phosphatase
MVKVLFVCMGNICRSPAAEGVFLDLVAKAGLSGKIHVDSAGTIGYHAGDLPDHRMRAADRDNLKHLLGMASTDAHRAKVRLAMDHARGAGLPAEVPDPYYGGPEGFERVLDMLEDACAGLLEDIRQQSGL